MFSSIIEVTKKNGKCVDGILSEEEFHKALLKERERSDRTGLPFSLIEIIPEDGQEEKKASELIKYLRERMRVTDELGFMEEGTIIGLLLPHTPVDGAWNLLSSITEFCSQKDIRIGYRLYSYPDRWWNTTDMRDRRKPFHLPSLKRKSGGVFSRFTSSPLPFWKRAIDVFVSLVVMSVLFPFFLLYALYLRMVSPGPVIFKQERVGYMGEIFTMYKLRTMHIGAPQEVHKEYLRTLIKSEKPMEKLDEKKDERVIPLCGIVRKLGIDELPQLINVLRGEMSLVGPRPCIPYEFEEFDQWQKKRVEMVPGLTGLWQVNGKNKTTFKEMIRLDIRYGAKISMVRDFFIMLKTFPVLMEQATGKIRSRRRREYVENY